MISKKFQSTPPARGATSGKPPKIQHKGISIHAPREGGDTKPVCNVRCFGRFPSTPPARGATRDLLEKAKIMGISIHAPREGGDIAHIL